MFPDFKGCQQFDYAAETAVSFTFKLFELPKNCKQIIRMAIGSFRMPKQITGQVTGALSSLTLITFQSPHNEMADIQSYVLR